MLKGIKPYDGEIAFTDEIIGELLEKFDEWGLLKNTLIILTADHGEAFFEHGVSGHSDFIYETTQHVPLIFWCPGLVPENKKIDEQVRLVDIAPTILDILGIEPPVDFDGVSLVDALIREKKMENLPSYCESYRCYFNFGWSKVLGLNNGDWKYILSPELELYNLIEDPSEFNNIYEDNPDVVFVLDDILMNIIRECEEKSGATTEELLDENTRRNLVSLGYVTSGGIIVEGKENIDPKDKKEFLEMFQMLSYKLDSDMMQDEVESDLIKMIEMEPDISLLYKLLARTYQKKKEITKAIKNYRKCVELNPLDFEARDRLANIHFHRGEYARAEKEVDKIIEDCEMKSEFLLDAYYLKGVILYEFHKDYKTALNYFERCIEMDNNFSRAYYSAAIVSYEKLRDYELTRKYGTRYLELIPDSEGADRIKAILRSIEGQ